MAYISRAHSYRNLVKISYFSVQAVAVKSIMRQPGFQSGFTALSSTLFLQTNLYLRLPFLWNLFCSFDSESFRSWQLEHFSETSLTEFLIQLDLTMDGTHLSCLKESSELQALTNQPDSMRSLTVIFHPSVRNFSSIVSFRCSVLLSFVSSSFSPKHSLSRPLGQSPLIAPMIDERCTQKCRIRATFRPQCTCAPLCFVLISCAFLDDCLDTAEV